MRLTGFFVLIVFSFARAQTPSLANYNIVWTSQSRHSGESMPCGGGDTGLNVWVEKGDLLLYVSRSGTFDENNALLKLGRLRLTLSPNPFTPGHRFRQELHLREGFVRVTTGQGRQLVQVTIWVDVFRPVVHLDLTSHQPLSAQVSYESWRTQDRRLTTKEGSTTSYKTLPGLEVIQRHDQVSFIGKAIRFYHRNRDSTVFDYTVRQ